MAKIVGFSWDTKFVGHQFGFEVLKIFTLLRRCKHTQTDRQTQTAPLVDAYSYLQDR